MFKEAAYWMYYFWSKNKRARKDKAVISNANVDDGNPVVF